MKFGPAKQLAIATSFLATLGYTFENDAKQEDFENFLKTRDDGLKGNGNTVTELFANAGIELEEGETHESAFASLATEAAKVPGLETENARLKPFEAAAAQGKIDASKLAGIAAAGLTFEANASEADAKTAFENKLKTHAREQLSSHGFNVDDAPEQGAEVDPTKPGTANAGLSIRDKAIAHAESLVRQ